MKKDAFEELKNYFKFDQPEKMQLTNSKKELINNLTKTNISQSGYKFKYAYVLIVILVITLPFLYTRLNPTPTNNNPIVENTLETSQPEQNTDAFEPNSPIVDHLNDQSLTYIVYNAIMSQEDAPLNKRLAYHNQKKQLLNHSLLLNNEEADETDSIHLLKFDEIEIYQSHRFMISLKEVDFAFLKNITGDTEIEVIIAFFGLSTDSIWMSEQMIIFKGKDGLYGCLGSTFGMILNDSDKIPSSFRDLYFGSYMMISGNELIKDYFNGEYYDFTVDLTNTNNIQLKIRESQAHEPNPDFTGKVRNYTALVGSYERLSGSGVLYISEFTQVEKVTFTGTITNIDYEHHIIFIDSETSINALYLDPIVFLYDQNGQLIELTDLNLGDLIETYYHKQYRDHYPTRIRTSTVTVINK